VDIKQKAIFLDRDGVLNPLVYNPLTQAYESPNFPHEFSVYTYAVGALRTLQLHGYTLIVVSNQPSYAKGKTSFENLQSIAVDFETYFSNHGITFTQVNYCYHHPDAILPELRVQCECRKPNTLHVERARQKFNLDLSQSYFIGDQDSDIDCGKRMGLKTISILNPHSVSKRGQIKADYEAENLEQALSHIMLK
jgi:D-glycero-D-manno-heptose 1,7-bisphosphate phosphatase